MEILKDCSATCIWCKYWEPSGKAVPAGVYETGTCKRYPEHVKNRSNDWCGEYTCGLGSS